ncbi:MAG: helix-turn-helix domain-containing protein [Solirubrobacteraceae bacterium]
MTTPFTASQEQCHVLRADPALAEAIPADRRQQAIDGCTARELSIPVGRWHGAPLADPGGGIGMLILSGLLIRRVGLGGRYGAELLGVGDVLRPWAQVDDSPTLPLSTAWRVLQTCRLAVLDEEFIGCMGAYPELAGALVGRAVGRSRSLAVNIAIVHQARVDMRLHMLMWFLAGRWGRVSPEGVTLPMRLTHAVLAELTAARRPTVTSALSHLAKQNLVVPTDNGWLLKGSPPGESRDGRLSRETAAGDGPSGGEGEAPEAQATAPAGGRSQPAGHRGGTRRGAGPERTAASALST